MHRSSQFDGLVRRALACERSRDGLTHVAEVFDGLLPSTLARNKPPRAGEPVGPVPSERQCKGLFILDKRLRITASSPTNREAALVIIEAAWTDFSTR